MAATGRYLAKVYEARPGLEKRLAFQHRLAAHLAANGLPVAAVLESFLGETAVIADGWGIELFEVVEGRPMHVTLETLEQAAATLAQFHAVCRGFPRTPNEVGKWRFASVPPAVLDDLETMARVTGDRNEVAHHAAALADFVHNASRGLSRDVRQQLEMGLVHGDWHPGNLFFREGTLTAILDFEHAQDGCLLEDVAYAVASMAIRTSTDPKRLKRRTRSLVAHYEKHRPLTRDERLALYYAVGIKQIVTVVYQLRRRGGEAAGMSANQWIATLAQQCAWLTERARKARWRLMEEQR